MARTDTLGHFLTDVADAIREKKGTSETITASDFDTEIENLPSGADLSQYFIQNLQQGTSSASGVNKIIKKIPSNTVAYGKFLNFAFAECTVLEEIPYMNTSEVTTMQRMCKNCFYLRNVPLLDTTNVTDLYAAFQGCNSLTNESLNNILGMCANATKITGTKSLFSVFGSYDMSSYYPASTIQTLSNYQDFIDAGWTIGW